MRTVVDLVTALLPLLYGVAAVNYAVYFARRDPFAERTCTRFLVGVVTLHFVFLVLRAVHLGRYPIAMFPEYLTVVAFAVAGVYLYVERIQRSKATGAFIIALVTVLQVAASTSLPHVGAPKSEYLASPLFGLHTMAAVLGYSALAVGAVYGVMFLLLFRALKRKNFGLLFERLPSLDVLASMGFGATLLGWLFLTATILIGTAMSLQLFPGFYRDPKFIITLFVWLFYGLAVAAYFLLGWRGARLVYLSLGGFAIAIVSVVGSHLVWHSFHAFFS
ncbi:MAG: cytochrome c biogenesis protein CcsA [Myxococcota bacterium]